MGQQIIITDDLDQTPDARTITFAYNGRPYEIDLSEKNVEKLEKALAPFINAARPAGSGVGQTRQRRTATGSSAGTKIDYTDDNHYGQLHRGRVTEEEAALVRANLDQANRNRGAAGQPPIDPQSEADRKRYGF